MEIVPSDPLRRPSPTPPPTGTEDATAGVTALYHQHYARLVRLAWLLTRDQGRSEEVVQDAFVELHQRWHRLADPSGAAGYLRTSVVNRSRSTVRHQQVVRRHEPTLLTDVDRRPDRSAEHDALDRLQYAQIVASLNDLPTRQREVLVLRYFGQLSEAEIADTLGISRGAVKSHSSRGLKALRPVLGAQA